MTPHPAEAFLASACPAQMPGYAWSVLEDGRRLAAGWGGSAVVAPEEHPVGEETLFDLASLTKPLATALVALKAADLGRLDLAAPAFEGARFSWLDLLRHQAGFPAWLPLYGMVSTPSEARDWLARSCPVGPAGEPLYGCPAYILLGLLLEARLGATLPTLFDTLAAGPLGIEPGAAGFRPTSAQRRRCAATELDGAHERAMARAHGCETYPAFLSGEAWGEVHDGNARFMGGAAGNAGLFGTLEAVERLALAFCPGRGFLTRPALDRAWTSPHPPGGERRTAGFRACDSRGWLSGALLPPGSVGHEGFTGTGLWMEPGGKRVYILLTNRIHPVHPETDFGPVRAGFLKAARGMT